MKPIGIKQVKEFDFPLASKAKAKSEERREIEAQVEEHVPKHELDADLQDYIEDLEEEIRALKLSSDMNALLAHWLMYAPITEDAASAFAHILDKPHHALSVVNELCQKAAVRTRDDIVAILNKLRAAGTGAYLSEGIIGRTKRAYVCVKIGRQEIVSTEYDCPSGDIDNRSES